MNKQIALITGATSGIGEACARKFAEGGYNLILTGRNAQKLNAIAAELQQTGVEVVTLVFDVRQAEAARVGRVGCRLAAGGCLDQQRRVGFGIGEGV